MKYKDRLTHNLKVVGSNPTPATIETGRFCIRTPAQVITGTQVHLRS